MASENPEVFLRVLYTVNTSPQYILAKTPHKIPFIPVDCASSSNSSSKHGRASVRACAMAICRSSPELRPDTTKDFSFYILDPLEDLMSRSRHGQSNGVAVAMGLLSTILSPYTPDSNMVTGTLVSCGEDQDALEVVVSLKQVAPPVMHALDDQCHGVSGFSGKKLATNLCSRDQPYYTSSPRPLPSLDERLFSSYALPQQNNSQSSRPKEQRRPNPAHFTRAHQLPTPYIGPPKRRYTREPTQIKDQAKISDFEDLSAGTSSDRGNVEHFSDPSNSQHSTSDYEASRPSFTHICLPGETSNLSQTMLAALSTVTPKPSDSEPVQPSQGNTRPNPELVALCQAYIARCNMQQLSPDVSGDISSHLLSHQATPTSTAVQESTVDRGVVVQDQGRGQHGADDKENQSPQTVVSSSKESISDKPTGTSPLGSGRFNARSSVNQLSPVLDMSKTAPTSGSTIAPNLPYNDCSRKRKLSDAVLTQSNAQVGKRCISSSKDKETMEDLSGVRVNSGWGGLRIRSDGRLWGEHLPQSSTSFPSSASSMQLSRQAAQQPALFRSSGTTSSAPVRKGPYVVPDWAKGVPPPAAPPRRELLDEDRDLDRAKEKKQSKSKGLGRLGGKGVVKRAASLKKTTDAPRPASPSLHQIQNEPPTQTSSYSPPKETPRRLPIFAYSSPGGKSGFASLFQAFQTSPCRPTSARKNMFSTPLRPATTSPGGSAERSSLFTPSPATARADSEFKPRRLFTDDDAPPSPTPTKKCSASPRHLMDQQDITSSGSPKPSINSLDEGRSDCPSSLPIASSDDFRDDNTSAQPPSVSSNSTITNPSKIHDWSSLDLPPSSPPPPSSPSIVPTEGSDLPCSDIPSSDVSEVESPPVIFNFDSSNYPSPAQAEGETPGAALGFDLSQASTNESMSEPFLADQLPPLSVTEEGPSSIASFEALQNGLGQEDLSEVWNVLNSLCAQTSSFVNATEDEAFDMQDWLIPSSDPAPASQLNASLADSTDIVEVGSNSEMFIGATRASAVAANFEDLFRGCLV